MVGPNDADLVLVRAALWLPFIASLHFSACPLLENSLFDTIGQYWFHVSAVPTPACQPCLPLYSLRPQVYLYHPIFSDYLLPRMLGSLLPPSQFPNSDAPSPLAITIWFLLTLVLSVAAGSASSRLVDPASKWMRLKVVSWMSGSGLSG